MTPITTEKGQTKTTLDIRKEYQKEAFLDAVYTAEYGDHIIYHQGPHVGGRHRVEALNASEKTQKIRISVYRSTNTKRDRTRRGLTLSHICGKVVLSNNGDNYDKRLPRNMVQFFRIKLC